MSNESATSSPSSLPPAVRATRSVSFALGIEHVWVLVALAIVSSFVALVPTLPNDFWWHLAAGRMIAREGIPATNLFAWSLPADTRFIYQSWLGEWLFYALYVVGGFPLTVFARNMLFTMAFALVSYDAYRRSGSWRLAALAVVLAGVMSMNNLTTRTQNWSLLPFMATSLLLGGYVEGRVGRRALLMLPAIMVFWVNAHGGFVTGLLLVGAYTVGETLRRLLHHSRALTWERLRWLYIAAGATLLATLVNPLGIGIINYVLLLLRDPSSQTLINEWQSPTTRTLAGAAFYVGVLALIAAFGLARRRPTITDVLLACGFGWMAFSGFRYVVWFGFIAMPLVAQSLAAPRSPLRSVPRRAVFPAANAVLAAALLVLVVSVQPWFKPLLPFPEAYRELFIDLEGAPQLFSRDTPVDATAHLQTVPCEGRLFNEMGQGSYLEWALYPAAQVFIDTRVELYPFSQWQDYIAITEGRNLDALLVQKYNVSCVLLDRTLQPRLADALAADSRWSRTFNGLQAEVWRHQVTR